MTLKARTKRFLPAQLLAMLLGVDGAGSGLDADLLDGQSGAYYTNAIDWRNPVAIAGATTLTAAGVGKVHVCTGTSADYTLTLPDSGMIAGDLMAVQMGTAVTLTKLVTLDATSGNLIDGQQTRVMWSNEVAILRWDGTNWTKIAGKSIPMNCRMFGAGGRSIATASQTKLTIGSTSFDVGGLADTSNSRVVIRRAGNYSLLAYLRAGALITASRFSLELRKNGSFLAITEVGASSTGVGITSNDIVPLVAADTIDAYAYQDTGSSMTTGTAPAPYLAVTEITSW